MFIVCLHPSPLPTKNKFREDRDFFVFKCFILSVSPTPRTVPCTQYVSNIQDIFFPLSILAEVQNDDKIGNAY